VKQNARQKHLMGKPPVTLLAMQRLQIRQLLDCPSKIVHEKPPLHQVYRKSIIHFNNSNNTNFYRCENKFCTASTAACHADIVSLRKIASLLNIGVAGDLSNKHKFY